MVERKLGGISVLDIKPKGWKDNGKVLVYVHGGAYTFQSAPLDVAAEHFGSGYDWPARDIGGLHDGTDRQMAETVDRSVAVFKRLQRGISAQEYRAYGDSAGGGLVPARS